MNQVKGIFSSILILAIFGLFSCVEESSNTLEKAPFFDLKGFIEEKIQEVDNVEVIKVSQIQENENQTKVVYSTEDWKEEFSIFIEADINKSSLLQSYKTISSGDSVSYELLPKTKGKVKFIMVAYSDGSHEKISSVSIKLSDDNLFYSSTTLADLYLNKSTDQIDHYSIETTQKIWFMDANNMKIKGTVVPKN